jgi:hypothetical protein
MTDPLTVVRDADPVAGAALDPAARERMDAAIDRLLAIERPPRALRAAGARYRSIAVAGTAATIALAVGLAALPSGGSHNPVAPEPASAAVALRQLAATAAQGPTPDGRYVYVHSRSYTTHMRPRADGHGTFATVVPTDAEIWVARNGSESIARHHELWDQATYPNNQDRDDAAAAAGPLSRPPDDGQALRSTDTKVAGFTVAELRALPTDPAALRTRLERAELGYDSPSPVVTVTGMVLGSPLTPPAVRAAAFTVLRGLPGATLVAGATDPTGRSGEAIEFDSPAWRTMFIFDPKTSNLIATRSTGKKELPGRDINDWTLQLDTHGTDSAPAARDFDEVQAELAKRDAEMLRRGRAARAARRSSKR